MNSSETTHNPLDGITATLEKALQQAREQADTIIADARKQADTIINDAREQAERITADAQADARAKGDMERASLAIQEHAAALHTLALGLTRHETTPRDNDSYTNGSKDDDGVTSSDTDTNETDTANDIIADNADTNDSHTIPPAPTVPTSRATATARPTTRRANGTTRKLAPWEQPEEPQSETATEPEETLASDTTSANAEQDATAPQWDAPLIIDAPLQL